MNSMSSVLTTAAASQVGYWVAAGIALIVAVAVAVFVWLDVVTTRRRREHAESLTRDLHKRIAKRQGTEGAEQEEVEALRRKIRDELETGQGARRLPPP